MLRKILSFLLALALTTPLFAQEKTDMQQLAADLQRVLGKDAVEVEGPTTHTPVEHTDVAYTDVVHTDVRGMSVEAIVEETNRERAAAGLRPLHLNPLLTAAAGDRMHDLFAKHYFEHVSPDGIDPFTWVDKRGYDYREIGENLAVGYHTAASVVDGWMHSPAHRENVLGAAYDEIGIAIADGSPRRPYGGPTVVALYGGR